MCLGGAVRDPFAVPLLESVFQHGALESRCLVMQENYPHLSDVTML